MRIEKNIKEFIVFSGDSVLSALNRINLNKSRIVFVVEDNGVLIGAVSDGDVRRWMTQTSNFDLNLAVDQLMNREFISRPQTESQNQIAKYFDHKRDIIPLTDDQGRFVSLARKSDIGIQIGNFLITNHTPTFIIAEIGNNHNGDLGLAKELVDLAIEANADCVKFQMRNLTSLYSNQGRIGEASYDLGSQYTLDLLNKFQLSNDKLFEVFDYCKKQNVFPLCTPWDLDSVRLLDEYGMEGFKVASADLTNYEMLEVLARTGKPLICSTGMSRESEILDSINLLRRLGASYALLHCNSTYPTPFKDINLNYLLHLKQISGSVVGYSGHERGYEVPLAAVVLGARIVEKHFTIDRSMEGNDHRVSLLPSEFAEMVRQIRNVEDAMGQDGDRQLTQGEIINRENLAKSIIINCDLSEGQVIQRHMISVKSPGFGIQPNRINEIVGKVVHRKLREGDFIFESDITQKSVKKPHYSFSRPYGIPVRYHDYQKLIDDMQIDFVEFHLSYHDLDVNLADYFNKPLTIGYAVHSPELFSGDHILDLAANDLNYLNHSINELRRTVAVTVELQKYFPATSKPVLVLNAGGWTSHGFLSIETRADLYKRIIGALEQVNFGSMQLAIQTMPPFPWHFGGQSYHNLFVHPDEISDFCTSTNYKICLDISHSMMSCNYYNWDFSDFLKKVLPHTIHLHIADAKGVDGEGIQFGHGDVNFPMVRNILNQFAPDVPFIPEVWQGHKNNGEGFWSALTFLEKLNL
jgi:sialic acid synthase SpsE/sugar phosphate isomerase/epimerase